MKVKDFKKAIKILKAAGAEQIGAGPSCIFSKTENNNFYVVITEPVSENLSRRVLFDMDAMESAAKMMRALSADVTWENQGDSFEISAGSVISSVPIRKTYALSKKHTEKKSPVPVSPLLFSSFIKSIVKTPKASAPEIIERLTKIYMIDDKIAGTILESFSLNEALWLTLGHISSIPDLEFSRRDMEKISKILAAIQKISSVSLSITNSYLNIFINETIEVSVRLTQCSNSVPSLPFLTKDYFRNETENYSPNNLNLVNLNEETKKQFLDLSSFVSKEMRQKHSGVILVAKDGSSLFGILAGMKKDSV